MQQDSVENPIAPVHDQCTYSNYTEVYTQHLHLDLIILFDKKIVSGSCKLQMKSLVDGLKVVYLDSRYLVIQKITYNTGGNGANACSKDLVFALEDPSGMAEEIGECLKIELSEEMAKD